MLFTPLLQGATQQAYVGQWQLGANAVFTNTASAATTVSPPFAVSVGQLIVVAYGWEQNSGGTLSVTDSAGNAYTALTLYTSAGPQWVQLFYCIATAASASNIVTATTGLSVSFRNLTVQVFQPPPGIVSIDTSSGGVGNTVANLTGVNVDPVAAGSSLVTFSSKVFNGGTYDPNEIGWQETDGTPYFISMFQNVSNGDPRPVGVKRVGGATTYVYAWASFVVTPATTGVHPLKTTRARQPQGPVEIDWSNPITRGLVVETGGHRYHGTRLIDGTVNQSTSTGAGVSLVHTRYGKALSFDGSQANGAASFGDTGRGDGYTQASWQVLFKHDALNTENKIFAKWGTVGTEQSWLISTNSTGTGIQAWAVASAGTGGSITYFNAANVFSATEWNNAVLIWRGGTSTANLTLIVNGVNKSASLSAIQAGSLTMPNGTGNLQLGIANDGGPMIGKIAVARMWKRPLSLAEALVLSANPWGILKTTRRVLGTTGVQGTTGVHSLRTRQTCQPQASAQIDWSNPITRGLKTALSPLYDHAKQQRSIPSGTIAYATRASGKSIKGNSSGLVYSNIQNVGDKVTVMYVGSVTRSESLSNTGAALGSTGGNESLNIQFWASAPNNRIVMRRVNNAGAIVRDFSANATTTGVEKAVIVGVFSPQTSNVDAYWNGKLDNGLLFEAGGSYTAGDLATINTAGLGGRFGGSVAAALPGLDGALMCYWDRALTASEIAQISANPWQIFKPTRRLLGIVTGVVVSAVTIYRPNSDIAVAGWTPSTGTLLYDMIDEVTPSTVDYITSPELTGSLDPVTFGIPDLVPGTYKLRFNAKQTGDNAQARLLLKNSIGNTVGTGDWQSLTNTFTTYETNITTTDTSVSVTIEPYITPIVVSTTAPTASLLTSF